MPVIGPVKRKELIRYLRKLGFEGPFSGGKHQFMLKDKLRLTLPNPHQQEISQALLQRFLSRPRLQKKYGRFYEAFLGVLSLTRKPASHSA